MKYENEIEVEIRDKRFLSSFLNCKKLTDFNSVIDKFFRNFELLEII